MNGIKVAAFSLVFIFAGIITGAEASIVDLSTVGAAGGPVNGAYFSQGVSGASGTGRINAFVRLNTNNSWEHGYNTDGRPPAYSEVDTSPHTHSILLNQVPTVYKSSVKYYEFLLDINEPNGKSKELISLDDIKVYMGSSGSFTTTTLSSLGALVYDLDFGSDSYIILNGGTGVDAGSGKADMVAHLPAVPFDDAVRKGSGQYVYLYSKFGTAGSAYINDASFEEWGVDAGPAPEPASLFLFSIGALGFGFLKRRR